MAAIDSTFHAAWGDPAADRKSLPWRGDCLLACLKYGQQAARRAGSR
jgi:hypothetical protein